MAFNKADKADAPMRKKVACAEEKSLCILWQGQCN